MSGYHAFAVLGTPAAGRIPVFQADGSVRWEDPSGGGEVLLPTVPGLPLDLPTSGPYATVFSFAGTGVAGQRLIASVVAQLVNNDVSNMTWQAQAQGTNLTMAVLDVGGEIPAGAQQQSPFTIGTIIDVDGPFTLEIGWRANGGDVDVSAYSGGYAILI